MADGREGLVSGALDGTTMLGHAEAAGPEVRGGMPIRSGEQPRR
jgi:hypothetical protein